MYRFRAGRRRRRQVQLLGAGTILREVIAAGELLEADCGIAADVWSVTSFTELARDGAATERLATGCIRARRRKRHGSRSSSRDTQGPVIVATDYVRAVAEQIRAACRGRRYVALGTDGFGRSDTRAALRDFFEVSRQHIVVAALAALADEGNMPRATVADAIRRYGIDAGAAGVVAALSRFRITTVRSLSRKPVEG